MNYRLPALVALIMIGTVGIGVFAGRRWRKDGGRPLSLNRPPDQPEDTAWLDEHRRLVSTFPAAVRDAHDHSSNHRDEVLRSDRCGCFYCGRIFPPSQITDWTDQSDEKDDGTTAICPFCGIDSVIGDRSGFPITDRFLRELNQCWFQA